MMQSGSQSLEVRIQAASAFVQTIRHEKLLLVRCASLPVCFFGYSAMAATCSRIGALQSLCLRTICQWNHLMQGSKRMEGTVIA